MTPVHEVVLVARQLRAFDVVRPPVDAPPPALVHVIEPVAELPPVHVRVTVLGVAPRLVAVAGQRALTARAGPMTENSWLLMEDVPPPRASNDPHSSWPATYM